MQSITFNSWATLDVWISMIMATINLPGLLYFYHLLYLIPGTEFVQEMILLLPKIW